MKRIGYLFQQVCSLANLYLADSIAAKGKAKQPGVQAHLQNRDTNIWRLHCALLDKTYRTSEYTTFKIYEPKEREIFRLPFIDRIVHHAIMNVVEPIFKSHFTADTYSCIKGRGIHAAHYKLRKSLKDARGTKYCLKVDIKKFYPSVDHEILKALLRHKFKDPDLLELLDGIIDSAPGLPIGNYLSQYFANYYLSFFDHWLKEQRGVRHYFRYADDLVFLAGSKAELHQLLADIRLYLDTHLRLAVKDNYQVFPVADRGIDFLGYVYYHDRTLLRKRIKKSFARAVAAGKGKPTIAAYKGWAKHCDSKHLLKKLLPNA